MNPQLFEIIFRVHLTREHPKYGEFEFGKLYFWIYAEDAEAAGRTAKALAGFLPYKIGPGKSFPITEDIQRDPYKELESFEVDCIVQAQIAGFNFAFIHSPKGTDEKEILGDWPLLVPPL